MFLSLARSGSQQPCLLQRWFTIERATLKNVATLKGLFKCTLRRRSVFYDNFKLTPFSKVSSFYSIMSAVISVISQIQKISLH